MSGTEFVAVCHAAVPYGVALWLQSGLVLLLGLGLATLQRRYGPLVRSLTLRATSLAVVLTFVLSLLLTPHIHPLWRVSFPSAAARERPLAPATLEAVAPPRMIKKRSMVPLMLAPDAPPTDATAASPELRDSPVVSAAGKAPGPARPVPPLTNGFSVALVTLWGVGTLCLLGWGAIGQVTLHALRRNSRPLTTGTAAELVQSLCPARPLPLRVSPHIRSPFLGGLWQPTVFLPATSLADFDRPTLRAILAHEMAHRDRCDNHWLLLTRLLCAVLWLQPLCWVLARGLEHASEEACDALALASGCTPRAYADCLLSFVDRTPSHPAQTLGVGIVRFHSRIGIRINSILTRKDHPMPRVSTQMKAIIAAGIGVSALSGAVLVSAGPVPTKATPAVTPPNPTSIASDLREEDSARFLAGLTAVQGPGVIVTLSDSTKKSRAVSFAHLIHDTDINQVINELKSAGAEAVAVNDQRLVATSPVRCAGPTVLVNNLPQEPPYVIRAIGNPSILQTALKLPGGVSAQLRSLDPLMVNITPSAAIILPAYDGPMQRRYARPLGSVQAKQNTSSSGTGAEPSRTNRKILMGFTQIRDKAQRKLVVRQASLAAYHRRLADAVHQAMPGADEQTVTQALKLEQKISHHTLALETVRYDRERWKSHQTPDRQNEDRKFIAEREKQLQPLLTEERQFIPNANARQQLAHVHRLAIQCRIREIEVMGSKIHLQELNRTLEELHARDGH